MAEGIVKTNGRILYMAGAGNSEWGKITGDIENQEDLKEALDSKQDKLTAGSNITINEDNVISATDTKYSAGYGLTLNGTTFYKNDTMSYQINQHTYSCFDVGHYDFDAYYGQAFIRISVDYSNGYEAVFGVQLIRASNGNTAYAWCLGSNADAAKSHIKALYVVKDTTLTYEGYKFYVEVNPESNSIIHINFSWTTGIGKYYTNCMFTSVPSSYFSKANVIFNGGSGGGTTYTSGNGINIDSDNVINVLAGNGLEFDANNKLQVKLGKGLKFDTEAGIEGEISIDDIGQEVIAEVQELASELDKKITTTFNYAQIKDMQDFAPYGVTGTTRLIGQLFAVPIASEIRKDETLLNVRALQNYSGKVSFGIFEFDFEGNEGTGSTTWLCDTGVVSIKAGENQMPVKHIKSTSTSEPKIKMMPGKLYYATVLIAGDAPATGLMLAADDPYEANYNATPKYTMIASNMDNYVDWSNGSQEATWFQGYNEFHNVPRLFMMIRNGEAAPVPTVDPFRNYDAFTLNHNTTVQDVFSLNIVPTNYPMIYQKIIPLEDVTITKVGWCDTNEQAVYDYYTDIPVMLNNTYTGIANFNNDMSTSLIDGTHYFHQCTLTNPVALQKGVIYWVPALAKIDAANEAITTYTTPADTTKDLVLFTSKWNISQWAIAGGYGEYKNTQPAPMCRITTEDGRAFTF